MNLETNVGVIDAEVIGSSVRIRFVSPSRYTLNVPVNVDGQTIPRTSRSFRRATLFVVCERYSQSRYSAAGS